MVDANGIHHLGLARGLGDHDVPVRPHSRQVIDRRVFQVIHLILLQRQRAHRDIGHGDHFHPLNLSQFAARQAIGRLIAGDIALISTEKGALARHPFIAQKHEGAGADDLAHLLGGRRGIGNACGHDEGHMHRRLAEGLNHAAIGPGEAQAKGIGPRRHQFRRRRHQPPADRIAIAPALERGHDILGRHRRTIMESEARAQPEIPGQLIRAHLPALQHLRLEAARHVHRDQRVIDEIGKIAGHEGGAGNRVQILQPDIDHKAESPLARLRQRDAGGGDEAGGGGQAVAAGEHKEPPFNH